MARPLRIQFPGAWYHVMNRGARGGKVFSDTKDYQAFLDLAGQCFDLFELEVHAYALLPNHYHLLVRTPLGNLSRAMRHLDGVFTQKVNRRYGTDGSIFRGRYKAILADEDSYLTELIRYIHRNPVDAGLAGDLGGYPWTSHKAYTRDRSRPPWLQCGFILKLFGTDEKTARRCLDAFVRGDPSPVLIDRLNGKNWPAILGSEKFQAWVRDKFLQCRAPSKDVPQLREVIRGRSLKDLKTLARDIWACDRAVWDKVRRGRENPKRRALIYASRKYFKATADEIGREFGGISQGAVSMQYNRAEREFREKRGAYEFIREIEEALHGRLETALSR